jgi:hypothetical protein
MEKGVIPNAKRMPGAAAKVRDKERGMKRVYIAGKYSAPNIIEGLENIRKGLRAGTEMLLDGNAVFCPWADNALFLQLREGESIDVETIKAHSMAWLEVSDIVYVLKDYQESKGTLAEIKRAEELNIPVIYEEKERYE